MSERKVLQKYYPPDFDPASIKRVRGAKNAGPRVQTVRLMAPFNMRCTKCGEYIYKGRKFNARKETPDEKYLGIQIFRFYIRCTRCSAEITFKTDPKTTDYKAESGAKRTVEPWRARDVAEETDEQRLDRLEQEQIEEDAEGERNGNAMEELEKANLDVKNQMAVADALDELRNRNARIERVGRSDVYVIPEEDEDAEAARLDEMDREAARKAFAMHASTGGGEEVEEDIGMEEEVVVPTGAVFQPKKRLVKTTPKIVGASVAPKSVASKPTSVKAALANPAKLLVAYDSDSD